MEGKADGCGDGFEATSQAERFLANRDVRPDPIALEKRGG